MFDLSYIYDTVIRILQDRDASRDRVAVKDAVR
jgi:hypothetical protein